MLIFFETALSLLNYQNVIAWSKNDEIAYRRNLSIQKPVFFVIFLKILKKVKFWKFQTFNQLV